jgi:tRNA 2-thiocytidine biosynthesis protein TtcA
VASVDPLGYTVLKMKRVENKLLSRLTRASTEHHLLEDGDRIMVAMSGGKDSYVMLHLLRLIQRRVPFQFELIAVNLDQGHPGFPGHLLKNWLVEQGYEHRMLAQDTYSVVLDKVPVGKTYCSLCSRLRRGFLYQTAVDLKCTKIALGHHRDDLIETLMLNLLYSGQLKTMPPRLTSDDGRNTVIRPLAYCAEEDIARYAEGIGFPIIPCDLCGTQKNLQRQRIKALLAGLQAENSCVKGNMMAAMSNVSPSHLLDLSLRKATGLDPITGVPLVDEAAPRVREYGLNQQDGATCTK